MKHKNSFFTNCSLPIALYILPIAYCLLPIASFAQNTFRYKFCNNISALPNWRIVPEYRSWGSDINSTAHQIPTDSGYVYFSTALYNNIFRPIDPVDSIGTNCFSATKTDKYGNLEWFKTYREKSFSKTAKDLLDGIPTIDGGFIMAGRRFGSGSTGSTHYENTLIQKTDKDGHILWAKTYDVGSINNSAIKIKQMPDEGYIILGRTKDEKYSYQSTISYDIYLLRIDKDGNKLWCNKYDAGAYGEETPNSIDIASDGGFIIGGYAYEGKPGANNTIDKMRGLNPKTRFFGKRGLLMKISANGQTVEWAKRYGTPFMGGSKYYNSSGTFLGYLIDECAFSETKQTSDGGYITVGESSFPYFDDDYSNNKNQGAWVVKTDGFGAMVWQKNYRGIFGLNGLELLNDGYILTNNEGFVNGYHSNLIKINTTGEVQWGKKYDKDIAGLNLTFDGGFIMSGNSLITKTNPSGEFDDGCFYNTSALVDDGITLDTAYTLNPKSIDLTPINIASSLSEVTVNGTETCPLVCNISDTPTLPTLWDQTVVCQNTDVTLLYQGGRYSFYKINFGDPSSGANNEIQSTPTNTNGSFISHNFASAGTFTTKFIVFNSDYSQSDTAFQEIVVVPQMKYKFLTPEIHVCKSDTVTVALQFENYVDNVYGIGYSIPFIGGAPTYTLIDSIYTISGQVVADASVKYYTMYYQNNYASGCLFEDTLRVYTGDIKAGITGNTRICKGGSATLMANGGDAYLWSTGATTGMITVKPESNKTYWVEATSRDGCRDTSFVYVQIIPDIDVKVFADGNKKICLGDMATLYATGAGNYSWNNGSTGDTIRVLPTSGQNTYVVTGTSGSCADEASIQISTDPMPTIAISGLPANLCEGTYVLKASGGAEKYYWMNSAEDNPEYTFVTGQSESGYLRLRALNGACLRDTMLEYNTLYSPGVAGIEGDECRVCPGTEVTVRKYFDYSQFNQTPNTSPQNQGLSYQWSTGQTGSADSIKIIVNKDTSITLYTTNSFGCKTKRETLIEVAPHFSMQKKVTSTPSCSNSPTKLFLIGEPVNYTWSTGSTNDTIVVSPLQDAMYYVTATVNGCILKDSIWVKAKSNLPTAWINGDSIVCKGSPGTYSAKGNIIAESYKWLTGNNADILPSLTTPITANTTLKVVLGFPGACTDTAEYKINAVDIPHAIISGDTVICPGGTSLLKASGGNTYRWSNDSTTTNISITALNDTPVSLYAFAGNCIDTASITVKTSQTLTATLFSDEDTTCTGTPLTLIAGGGDHYSWNTGHANEMLSILPAITTTYTVSVITDDNCKDVKTITITVKPIPTAAITGSSIVCAGDSLTLSASGGDNYVWNTGEQTSLLTIDKPSTDGNYWVVVTVGSCEDTAKTNVSVVSKPVIDAGTNVSINYGNSVALFATGIGSYQWSPVTGLSCTDCASPLSSPATSTLYYITLKDDNGCKSTDSVMVFVDLPCGDIFVPTAFSPNNDGNNDMLFVRGRCIQSMNFIVYDRWGEKVFEAANSTKGWDGTYNDKPMNPAVFVYALEVTTTSGEVLSRKGMISLTR